MGRPLKGDEPRSTRMTIRVSASEAQDIQECASKMNITRTDALMSGISLLKKKIYGKGGS